MKITSFKDTFFSETFSLNCRGRLVDLSEPKIMGILNITDDSFYDGGKYTDNKEILKRTEEMIRQGADIIDIGAMSTRPGSKEIAAEKETERLRKALEIVRNYSQDILISVDTYRPQVAEKMIHEFGADIINDISAGGESEEMFGIAKSCQVPIVIMHMQGKPENMQKDPRYRDVVDDVLLFMAEKVSRLRSLGVCDIIVDPGFGFGKTPDHNYQLLSQLDVFRVLQLPILAGLSRKSMISRFLNISAENSLNGTTALNMFALLKGAKILRVHDVKEAVEVRKLYFKLRDCK